MSENAQETERSANKQDIIAALAAAGISLVKAPENATAQRLTNIFDEVEKTRIGWMLMEHVSHHREKTGMEVVCAFDHQIGAETLGYAVVVPEEKKHTVALSPWSKDHELQGMAMHEFVHVIQTMQQGVLTQSPDNHIAANIFCIRMKEGEAYTYQILFGLDKLRDAKDTSIHVANLMHFGQTFQDESCFQELQKFCNDYLTAETDDARLIAAGDIFWAIQRGRLASYDTRFVKAFQEQEYAQKLINHWKYQADPEYAGETKRHVYETVLEEFKKTPLLMRRSDSDTEFLPHFLARWTPAEIIQKMGETVPKETHEMIAAEEQKIKKMMEDTIEAAKKPSSSCAMYG